MSDDDDEWDRCEGEDGPQYVDDVDGGIGSVVGDKRKASGLEEPPFGRQKTDTDGDHDPDGEADLLQSMLALADDVGIEALMSTYDTEIETAQLQEQALKTPSENTSLSDIIGTSLAERTLSKRKGKKKKEQEAVEENTIHITSRTYHNKQGKAKPWTQEETRRLLKVLQQYGPEFSLLQVFFPGRDRNEIKLKFKREDKKNPDRMTYLLKHRRPTDRKMYEEWKEKSLTLCPLLLSILNGSSPAPCGVG